MGTWSALLGLLEVGLSPGPHAAHATQVTITVGIDADPAGNSGASLGPVDPCVSVATGESFDVDVFVTNVTDLLGWQATLGYDNSMLELVAKNVDLFWEAKPGASPIDVSGWWPAVGGRHVLAAADLSGAPGQSGTGVLARVTFKAVQSGETPLTLDEVVLSDSLGNSIGAVPGAPWFEGPVSSAQVWVDQSCPDTLPTLTAAPPTTALPAPTPTTAVPATATPTVGSPTPPATAVAASPTPTTAAPSSPTAAGDQEPSNASPNDGGDDGFPWPVAFGIGGFVAGLAVAFVLSRALRRAP